MSVEWSMLAVAAERYEALRSDTTAVTDEVILRGGLDHLAVMSICKGSASEGEVLAQIRADRHLEMVDDLTMRRQMAELYARQDALVDASLARGDRVRPLSIGTNWQFLSEILADGDESGLPETFFLHAPRFGDDVDAPAGLHDAATVARFAAYLEHWSPERFAAAAKARRPPILQGLLNKIGLPGTTGSDLDAELFLRFKTYIMDAAAARAGMLIWMS
jgi:hypothetical protein